MIVDPNMRWFCPVVVAVILLLYVQTCVLAVGPRNLALHTRLEYEPSPEYHLTVDPCDPCELTDGIKDKSLWFERYRRQTVGWYPVMRIGISIDLGQPSNVGTINVYTTGGGQGGVEYPEYIVAATSLDGRQYRFADYATSDGWVFGGNTAMPRTLSLTVEQRARYIRLFVRPTQRFFFIDEIEVMESQNEFSQPQVPDYMSQNKMIELVERARQLEHDIEVLAARLSASQRLAGEPAGNLQELRQSIASLSRKLTEGDIIRVEGQFAAFRAKALRAEYGADWFCYQADPMDILRCGDLPPEAPETPNLSFYQWKNEHGVAAVNLVNASASTIDCAVRFSPLRFGDKVVESSGVFELRRALYVRVPNAGLVADPLVRQDSRTFPVCPGQTVQLWIDANSMGLEPGNYVAAMAITASGGAGSRTLQSVPISLDIAERSFAIPRSFETFSWDYVTASGRFTARTTAQTQAAVLDLASHYINIMVLPPEQIFDRKAGVRTQKIQDVLSIEGKSHPFVLLFLGGEPHLRELGGALRTQAWERAFCSFLVRLRDTMFANGYDYDTFAVHPFDETIDSDFVYVTQVIRKIDPRLKIYANKWIEPGEYDRVKDLIDIWCPHAPAVLANMGTYERYKETKHFWKIWCYHANMPCERFFAPDKTGAAHEWRGDNGVLWRTLPITAGALGMTGLGFWTYQDADRSGWDKSQMGESGVIYDGMRNPDPNCVPELIVPSKRWQQWREGVEDAVCLMGHKELLDEFMRTPASKLTSEYITSLRKRADKEKQIQSN